MRTEDTKNKLVEYFKKNLRKGYPEEALKWALINQGYSRTIIDMSLEITHKQLADEAPLLKDKPKINYEVLDENNQPVEVKKPWWKFW
jgi:hypothetical protein